MLIFVVVLVVGVDVVFVICVYIEAGDFY